MSRVIADGLSKRVTAEFAASETDAGFVEKATTSEAEAGTAGKFPDAAGVRAAFNQYGLGATTAAPIDNIDSLIGSGMYSTSSTTPGTFPVDVGGTGVVVHTSQDEGSTAFQTFYSYPYGMVFTRAYNSGVWRGWQPFYTHSNILGTVSQSAGVPTGAIIESGSNGNGEYTKFADGTLICATQVSCDFTGAFDPGVLTTWATPFVNTKYSMAATMDLATLSTTRAKAMSEIGTIATSSSQFLFSKADGNNFAETRIVTFTGIGRWF